VVTAGYLAGHSYQRVEKWFGTGAAVLLAVIVVVGLAVWALRRRRADRHTDSAV